MYSRSLKEQKPIVALTSIPRVDEGSYSNMGLLLVSCEDMSLASGISCFEC